jgi:hypothetical protein
MSSSYLHRTNSSGSGTTATVSMWVKQNQVVSDGGLAQFLTDTNNFIGLYSNPTVKFRTNISGSTAQGDKATLIKNRDPAAWYHYVFVFDTTNGTPGDRMRLWINGVRVTDAQLDTDIDPSSSYSFTPLVSGQFQLNRYNVNTTYSDHEYSHVHYTDGYAYDASTFGEFDATSGIWKIKTGPSVTYGTNGFFLKFEDRTNLDLDSGTNTFTDFTTVGTITATYDNPSNNFATLNPLDNYYPASTFSYGNNRIATSSSPYSWNMSTLGVSAGKWYFEAYVQSAASTSEQIFGISPGSPIQNNKDVGGVLNGYGYYGSGSVRSNGSAVITGMPTYTTGDYVGCAFDLDNNKIYFHDNGTYINSGDPSAGTGGYAIVAADSQTFSNKSNAYFPSAGDYDSSGAATWDVNFGNGYFGTTLIGSPDADDGGVGAFKYTVPTGFRALCTKNIKLYG